MKKNGKKIRKSIPTNTTRSLLIECGFKCSVPQCSIEWPTLHQHHIDENPSNNDIGNILMLCPTHHQKVTSGEIDRKTCKMLKGLLTTFNRIEPSPDARTRSRLLYSFASELAINMLMLAEEPFHQTQETEHHDLIKFIFFPRLRSVILDQILASGLFIERQDKEFFDLLYDWTLLVDRFNRGLDLVEQRYFSHLSPPQEAKALHRALIDSPIVETAFKKCFELFVRIVKDYDVFDLDEIISKYGTEDEELSTHVLLQMETEFCQKEITH